MKMRLLFILTGSLLLTALTFILYSCSCSRCDEQENSEIPLEILRKADSFVISKTGEEFFRKYITPNYSKSKFLNPNYLIVYNFYMPEKSFVNNQIRFSVDSTGNVLTDREIFGIPECNLNPFSCDFIIDENTARQIATEYGLEKGIKDWDAGFIWDAKYNRYVWHIISTLEETRTETSEGKKARGKEIIIDPTSGEVIARNDWRIF
jgi:hypothetical protein